MKDINRLKKKDKEVVRRHLEDLGQRMREKGAAHVKVGNWSHGRLGLDVFWGAAVNPRRPHETCERHDWLCADWDHHDGAWRLYGAGVPLHTEGVLGTALRAWIRDNGFVTEAEEAWRQYQSSKSERRWETFISAVVAVVHRTPTQASEALAATSPRSTVEPARESR